MKSPGIQLYNAVFSLSLDLGYDTIDYSPVNDAGLSYPFVHVGETTDEDVVNNKQTITGRLTQTIHVWGYANNRALFSDMVFNLKQKLRTLDRLENYYVEFEAMNSNDIYDNTTDDSLLHGIIEAEYKLS